MHSLPGRVGSISARYGIARELLLNLLYFTKGKGHRDMVVSPIPFATKKQHIKPSIGAIP